MTETVMTEEEYNSPQFKAQHERIALQASDCTRIEWHDVTENEACQELYELN